MRQSGNEYDRDGRLMNGFDYTRQAWAVAGRWVRCGHPEAMGCRCWGRVHEGEETPGKGGR